MIKYGVETGFNVGDLVSDTPRLEKTGSVQTVNLGKVVSVSHEDNKVVAKFGEEQREYTLDGVSKHGSDPIMKMEVAPGVEINI